MTPLVEALVLPCLLLTVVLFGAIRPGAEVTMAPPSLASLVLAVVLMSILVRSGALAPERLVNRSRSPLENVNGLTVLLTVFAASAQVVTLVLPESGVPELIGWVVLVSLLLQAFAIAPDRSRVRRGLAVTFGAAFVLKFILLAALSSPAEGGVARALQLLFDGVTLGSVTQRAIHPAEGYIAFATLVLYLVGVAALPGAVRHTTPPGSGSPRLPRPSLPSSGKAQLSHSRLERRLRDLEPIDHLLQGAAATAVDGLDLLTGEL